MTSLFKKLTISSLSFIVLSGIVLSVGTSEPSEFNAQAALTETHRIWFNFGNLQYGTSVPWTDGNAHTYVYAWINGGAPLAAWPGTKVVEGNSTAVNYDVNNSSWYFDVAQTYNRFKFVRVNPTNSSEIWEQTNVDDILDSSTSNYKFTLGPDFLANENRQVNAFTSTTTKVVSDLANSIDTFAEACSSGSAQTAIDTYNGMSTFDQNQFDNLIVGEGFTGLQRLQYLKSFYSIATNLI